MLSRGINSVLERVQKEVSGLAGRLALRRFYFSSAVSKSIQHLQPRKGNVRRKKKKEKH